MQQLDISKLFQTKFLATLIMAAFLFVVSGPKAAMEFVTTDIAKNVLEGFLDHASPANLVVTARIGTTTDAEGNLFGEQTAFDTSIERIAVRVDYQGAVAGRTHFVTSLASSSGEIVVQGACNSYASSESGATICNFSNLSLGPGQYTVEVSADGAVRLRNTFEILRIEPPPTMPALNIDRTEDAAAPAGRSEDAGTSADDEADPVERADTNATGFSGAARIFPNLRPPIAHPE